MEKIFFISFPGQGWKQSDVSFLFSLKNLLFDSQPEGLGVAFFATGPGLGLNVYLNDTRIS